MIPVFLHGAGCTPDVFASQLDAFPGSSAPDLHALAPGAASVAEFALALRSVLDDLDDGFALIGSSMGAAVALEVAIAGHPGLRAFGAIGCGPRLSVAPVLFERMEADFDAFARRIPSAFFASPDPARSAAATADMLAVGARRTIADFRACDRWGLGDRSFASAVPAVVLVGELDVMTPVSHGLALADRIPGAELRILPGTGHLATIEDPGETNAALRAFLTPP